MKKIISRQNQEISSIALLANPQERARQGKFVAEGLRCCATLLQSNLALVQLYVVEELLSQAQNLVQSNTLITLVSQPVIEKISQSKTPSGIVGVFHIPPPPTTLHSGLVLLRINDPGNMGTLIRSCSALNIKSVVIIEGADVWSSKVVQASAGTLGTLDIFRWSWQDLIARKKNHPLYALVVKDGIKPSGEHKNGLLVVGNEAHGIPQEFLTDCDEQLTIPMPGGTESLNAAIAGSIGLYLVFS